MLPAKKTLEQGWYAKIENAALRIPSAGVQSTWCARNGGIPFFIWTGQPGAWLRGRNCR
jgi:hypothetical protein